MKTLMYIFSFLLIGSVYAQDTTNTREKQRNNRNAERENRNNQRERPNYYEIVDTTDYTLDKQRYLFTPTEDGVNVQRVDDEEGQIDYGNLRRTTADGYYMMITTPQNETSFGRFDEEGNFRSYRYDAETDTIIEENFIIQDPVQRRDQNRRNYPNRGRNDDRNNNRNNNNRNNN